MEGRPGRFLLLAVAATPFRPVTRDDPRGRGSTRQPQPLRGRFVPTFLNLARQDRDAGEVEHRTDRQFFAGYAACDGEYGPVDVEQGPELVLEPCFEPVDA